VTRDEEHLRLLSIFHYVVAGITALFGCFPIFHLVFGLLFLFAPGLFDEKGGGPPALFGLFFVVIALFIMAMFWTLAVVIFMTGRFLAARKHYLFCLVVAGIECCFGPFGTVLGVFTIVVLVQESVKALFYSAKLATSAPSSSPFAPAAGRLKSCPT
jgi:hypothetical protein